MGTLRTVDPPKSYWEDKTYGPVAALGLMAVMFSLAVGAIIGLYSGDFFAGGDAAVQAQRQGVTEATSAWNPFVWFTGAALLMAAVNVVLLRILKALKTNGEVQQAALPRLIGGGK